MRNAIDNLVMDKLKRDKDKLVQELTQLRNFFDTLRLELAQGIGKENIRKLCNYTYDVKVEYKKTYTATIDAWNKENDNGDHGLFGFKYNEVKYKNSLANLNDYLYMQFFGDFNKQNKKQGVRGFNNYKCILKDTYNTYDDIFAVRKSTLESMLRLLATPVPVDEDDLLCQIFGKDLHNKVRYISAIKTTIRNAIDGMFVADGVCNVFVDSMWFQFPADRDFMNGLVENKRTSESGEYEYDPDVVDIMFPVKTNEWVFRFANRDLSTNNTGKIRDAYVVHFTDGNGKVMWYLSSVDAYLMCQSNTNIVDLAYVQSTDSTYVLFQDDPYLYRFDHLS